MLKERIDAFDIAALVFLAQKEDVGQKDEKEEDGVLGQEGKIISQRGSPPVKGRKRSVADDDTFC